MEKPVKNVKRAFRFLSLVFGFAMGSLIGTSLKYFIENDISVAIYLVLLATLCGKLSEWFSFNGLRG